jgi:hypothetical protein
MSMKQKVSPHLPPHSSSYQLPRQLPMALPGLTVVIINTHQVATLPRAIRSALTVIKALRPQNIPADILVIDNGSRDGSVTLLRQLEAVYFEAGLRVFALPQPISLVAMHNLALVQARYRTMLLGDVDVEFGAENIMAFYEAMQETEAAVIYGHFTDPKETPTNILVNEAYDPSPWLQPSPVDSFALYDRHQIFDVGGFGENQPDEVQGAKAFWSYLSACGRKQLFIPLLLGIYHKPSNAPSQRQLPSHPPMPYHPDKNVL